MRDVSFELPRGAARHHRPQRQRQGAPAAGRRHPGGERRQRRGARPHRAAARARHRLQPEFTGRENVYLNGALLGLSQDEVGARFDPSPPSPTSASSSTSR
ncbi:MAG: hypothetical protein U0802_14630 [Candidatus Binatia bacterium]